MPAAQQKHILQRLLERAIESGECCESNGTFRLQSYSGRAMFGRDCLGVVVQSDDLGALWATIMQQAVAASQEDDFGDQEYQLIRAVRGHRQDNMGYDMIVYFPSVEYVEEYDDEEEDEVDQEEEEEEE